MTLNVLNETLVIKQHKPKRVEVLQVMKEGA